MKKVIRNLIIILVVFAGSAVVFSLLMNRGETVETVPETAPELPVVSMVVDGTAANEMFGVRQELAEQSLRDSVTPLPADKSLTFRIDPKGKKISGISYSVTEPADGTLIENGQITDLTDEDDQTEAAFTLQGNIRRNQEYTLRLSLDVGEDTPINYYTRLVQGNGVDLSDYFTFAEDFSETCLDKLEAEKLSAYMETDDTASNRSFTDVNIHSSIDMISWGDLAPEMVSRATPKICEVNRTTASIELDYLISAADAESNTEYYSVSDFFRLGMGTDGKTVSLLNFERSAHLIYDGSNDLVLTDNGLDLGVQERDVQYLADKDNDIVAFVLNGDLWSYNQNTGNSTKIFSFRQSDENGPVPDDRTDFTPHDIRIGRVSDDGDVTFVVYGYMASGSHEGCMGVSVEKYSAHTNQSEEEIFIPLSQGFASFGADISRLSYVSDDGNLYLFLGSELARVSLRDGSYTVVQEDIDPDGFQTSESQATAAWVNATNRGDSTKATVMDLTDGSTSEIDAPAGEWIVACGFVNEDFVYGLVKPEDVVRDSSGGITCGMYRVVIQASDGTVKKDYERDGAYITSVEQETDGLELHLASRTDDGFKETGTDHIVNNEKPAESVAITAQVYERTKQKILLTFPETVSGVKLNYSEAGIRYTEAGAETVLEWPDTQETGYFVYGEGRFVGIYDEVSRAVNAADAVYGVVLNGQQQYVWVRGDWGTSYTIDASTLPEGVTGCGLDADRLQQLLGNDYTVENLTGVPQDDLPYMIANGYPVIGLGNNGTVYCIIGYDADNIWVYDAETKEPKAIASDDSRAEFEANGNRFLSYIAN